MTNPALHSMMARRYLTMQDLVRQHGADIRKITAEINHHRREHGVMPPTSGKRWTEESVRSYLRGAGLLGGAA